MRFEPITWKHSARARSEAIIFPSADGSAIELLLDFGREVVGYLEFEVSGEAQVILDLNCFEGIQEGRWLFTEGLNNVLRYYTREGRQFYHSVVRRGFRYALLTLRGLKTPFRIRYVRLLQNTYPTANTASFRCSDYLLNSIWDLSRYQSPLLRGYLCGLPSLRTGLLGGRCPQ